MQVEDGRYNFPYLPYGGGRREIQLLTSAAWRWKMEDTTYNICFMEVDTITNTCYMEVKSKRHIISLLTMTQCNQTLQYFLGAWGISYSTLPREYTN